MESASPLAVGGRLVIEGEPVFVCSVNGTEVRGFIGTGAGSVLTPVAERKPVAACEERWRFGWALVSAGG